MPSRAAKPVKLQVNTSGAWRNVIAFDAANDSECADVLEAAERLGAIGQAAMRVVMAGPGHTSEPVDVLMYWNPESARWRVKER